MSMIYCKSASKTNADDIMINHDTENLCSKNDASSYCSLEGALIHTANMTMPDI